MSQPLKNNTESEQLKIIGSLPHYKKFIPTSKLVGKIKQRKTQISKKIINYV